ncbi:MAG: alpha/beta fold hydrolase [Thermomicrobiales bacterium]
MSQQSSASSTQRVSRRQAIQAGGMTAASIATGGIGQHVAAQDATPVKVAEESGMRPLLSDYEMWESFGLRALAYVLDQGADFGDCISTISRIPDGDHDAWAREWKATGDRMIALAEDALAAGDRVSAREAYYRASNYYRVIQYPLFGYPVDPRLVEAFEAETAAFLKGAELSDFPIESVEIPFEGTTLPGYLVLVDDSGKPRPTIVHTNGYDSDIQEMFFAHAIAAVKRGYNVLLFDGPGQGRNLIINNMHMRPDWETVVTPVIDYALTRPEIDPGKIALAGWSFGGWLAPRAACFEHRIAALIADPGQYDEKEALLARLPLTDEQKAAFPNIPPSSLDDMQAYLESPAAPPMLRWSLLQRGYWVNGVDSVFAYAVEFAKYEISPYVKQINTPTFISQAQDDPVSAFAPQLYDAIEAPKVLEFFTSADGAGMHCEMLARTLYHQKVFAWLDKTLGVDRNPG